MQLTLDLAPSARFDVIDLTEHIDEENGDFYERYRRALYCSHHTTAGFLEERLCERMQHDRQHVETFVRSFQELFPPDADYKHDQIDLRTELTDAQKVNEPLNADSHLTFIGSGLENCVTYRNQPGRPVFFIDLDGTNGDICRQRRATVVGYNAERVVETLRIPVGVSSHSMDSVNLREERFGLYEQIGEAIVRSGIRTGRVDVRLASDEKNAGLTVNEFETLLMRNDLRDVLRNPMHFMKQKSMNLGHDLLTDPRSVPSKVKNYAKYDLVQLVNRVMDALGASESVAARVVDRLLAMPARRFLRMKRSLSLLVTDPTETGTGSIVHGTYQSPILVQWRKHDTSTRILEVDLVAFE